MCSLDSVCLLWQKSCWHKWNLNAHSDYKLKFTISKSLHWQTFLKCRKTNLLLQIFSFLWSFVRRQFGIITKIREQRTATLWKTGPGYSRGLQMHPVKRFRILTIPSLVHINVHEGLTPHIIMLRVFACISISQSLSWSWVITKTGHWTCFHAKTLPLADEDRSLTVSEFGALYYSHFGKMLKAKILFIPFLECL